MAENVPQGRARSARTNRFRPLLVAHISNNEGPAQTTVYYGPVGLSATKGVELLLTIRSGVLRRRESIVLRSYMRNGLPIRRVGVVFKRRR